METQIMTRKTKNNQPPKMPSLSPINPETATKSMEALATGLQFMTTQMQSSLAAQQALMACKTPAEVFDVQRNYLQTAIEQYTAATQELMGAMCSQMSPAQTGVKRSYDDVPL